MGVQREQSFFGRRYFGLAYAGSGVGNLALQVGELNVVVIHQSDLADSGAGQVHRCGGAQAASANNERVALQNAGLAFDANVVQQDMAGVAQQFLVLHAALSHPRLTLPWFLVYALPRFC